MFTSLDILYFVGSICLIALTVALIMLVFQLMQILRDISRISQNVEEVTVLVEKVAQVVFPGILHVAKSANNIEDRVAKYLKKKVDKFID